MEEIGVSPHNGVGAAQNHADRELPMGPARDRFRVRASSLRVRSSRRTATSPIGCGRTKSEYPHDEGPLMHVTKTGQPDGTPLVTTSGKNCSGLSWPSGREALAVLPVHRWTASPGRPPSGCRPAMHAPERIQHAPSCRTRRSCNVVVRHLRSRSRRHKFAAVIDHLSVPAPDSRHVRWRPPNVYLVSNAPCACGVFRSWITCSLPISVPRAACAIPKGRAD